jgi:hypothetical protein
MVAADFDAYAAMRSAMSTSSGRMRRRGIRKKPIHNVAAWAGSRRTAPSANMQRTSGTCQSDHGMTERPKEARKNMGGRNE